MPTIADALFTKTQQKVLGLLYGRPNRSFYTNEILRSAGMGRGSVTRELDRLTNAGIITMRRAGNQHHYQANPLCPLYEELISVGKKTFGLVDVISESLQPVQGKIELAFIFGSIAKAEETAVSDVDLMIVSDSVGYTDLMEFLMEAEKLIGRPINPVIFSVSELKKKLNDNNAFVTRVFKQPKLWIVGTENDIGEFGQDSTAKARGA